MIDTHAHLDFGDFSQDLEQVVTRAKKSGVKKIITVGIDLKSSRAAIDLAAEFDDVYATVSLHPIHAEDVKEDSEVFSRLREIARNNRVVAIGECGLDYHSLSKQLTDNSKQVQRAVFSELVTLAKELNKPIIIHVREADDEMIEILKSHWEPGMKGVIHCFGRGWDIAKKYLDLGLFLSFTGNITYGLTPERKKMIKKVPLNKIMIETDCPFMTPQAQLQQGIKRNEPAFVVEVAKMIAKIKEEGVEKIDEKTTKNAEEFFKI